MNSSPKKTRATCTSPDGGLAVPEGAPRWITPALIRETITAWQPLYRDSITVDEAVMILTRVGQLFEVLSRG